MDIFEEAVGGNELLLGNEAIARGAIEAGLDVAAAYPGTPSSEIIEELGEASEELDFHVEWSTNEKVAFEVGVGASLTGVRSLVSMKHAGLNWAMDPFMTIVYGGIRGGFVVVVADDPGAHYSSNEQDTRFLARYAEIPCLEPANQQEAKDMTKFAFELSENVELPVFLRSVTRVSHTHGAVDFDEIDKDIREPKFDRHHEGYYRWNVYGGSSPVEKHGWLKGKQPEIREQIQDLPWNSIDLSSESDFGIIGVGVGMSYVKEALSDLGLEKDISVLKIGTSYPLPREKVENFLRNVELALVVEEGGPFVEKEVERIAKKESPSIELMGRLTGHMPEIDEINSDLVKENLRVIFDCETKHDEVSEKIGNRLEEMIIPRSSTLCPGCPHLGTFWGLKEVVEDLEGKTPIINGDIGCYEIAGYGSHNELESYLEDGTGNPELTSIYELIDTNYVMGGGIGLMQGQAQAGYSDGPVISVAGDSTFFHSTLPAIVNAVYNDVDGLFIVLDNRWTCMTGHQPNPGSGEKIMGRDAKKLEIVEIVKSLGVENVREVRAHEVEEVGHAIQSGINEEGLSVVVSKRPCVVEILRRGESFGGEVLVDSELCIDCEKCVELGCPAINYEDGIIDIDDILCVDCGLCAKICPTDALERGVKDEL